MFDFRCLDSRKRLLSQQRRHRQRYCLCSAVFAFVVRLCGDFCLSYFIWSRIQLLAFSLQNIPPYISYFGARSQPFNLKQSIDSWLLSFQKKPNTERVIALNIIASHENFKLMWLNAAVPAVLCAISTATQTHTVREHRNFWRMTWIRAP